MKFDDIERDEYESRLKWIRLESGLLKKREEKGMKKGLAKGRKEGIVKGRKEGIVEGRKEGIVEGRKEGIVEGRKEGIVEGRKEGIVEGIELERKKNAMNMKAKGFDNKTICECLGVSESELNILLGE
jgi:predicted transposase YdaD